jgi:sensor histidine kinase YesM
MLFYVIFERFEYLGRFLEEVMRLRRFFHFRQKIWIKFFIYILLAVTLFSSVIMFGMLNNFKRSSLKQYQESCYNYIQVTKSSLSSFTSDAFSLTCRIYDNSDLIQQLSLWNTSSEAEQNSIQANIAQMLGSIHITQPLLSITLYLGCDSFHPVSVFQDSSFSSDYISGIDQWINKAKNGDGEMFLRAPFHCKINNRDTSQSILVMSFLELIKGEKNEHLAVLCINYSGTAMSNFLQQVTPPDHSSAYITNADNVVLASSNLEQIGTKIKPSQIEEDPLKIQSAQVTYQDGLIMVRSRYYFEAWEITIKAPIAQVLKSYHLLGQSLLSISIFLILLLLSTSFFLSQLFIKPINRLLESIHRVYDGNLSARIENISDDEIGAVQKDFNAMMDSIEALLQENYAVKLREKEAQLKTMEAQINPHFLYNTLDTINWKVMELGGSDTCQMIMKLSQILRYSISNSKKIVSLKEELMQIENYLYIQQIRFQDRISFEMNIDPATLSMQVHKLLLQPIVENAIIHGLENCEEGGIVRISARITDRQLLLEVYDNGKGMSKKLQNSLLQVHPSPDFLTSHHTKIGINNVFNRMQYYYDELSSQVRHFV